MKKFSFSCLIVLLFSLAANAQEVHIGKSKVLIVDKDTVSKGGTYYRLDSLTIQKLPRKLEIFYYIVNTGMQTISTGKVSHGIKVNGINRGIVDSTSDTIKNALKPGDSVQLHGNIEASSAYFKKGNNIVVAWPTGASFYFAGDSVKGKIKVLYGSSGIFSIKTPVGTDLKVFPQPAISDLHIICDRQGILIKSIRVFDITGRQIFYDQSESITTIHADAWKAGAYIMEATLSNGEVQRMQISKSR